MGENEDNSPLPGVMPGRTPENAPQPADFVPMDLAKALLRATRTATLATLDRNTGHPFASLVNVATDVDGAPLILVSRLATHTANLELDGRASLLLASLGKGDALTHPRLTVLGTFALVASDGADAPRLRRRFLARQPKAKLYAGFPDFAFWRMQVVSAHLNGGFARAADLTAADVLIDVSDAEALIEAEEGAVAHMNEDHAEACRLYATKLLGAPNDDWRCAGINPDGIELQNGPNGLWLPFPQAVTGPGPLRAVLKQLAEQARGR
ncbi:MAG: pyridoxamine 5'-phosphate oxidase family protein [Pseudolabrys sp.]|nr:pyridoxamine 5'-phosphate oxidase family protein [Pseudolabrys sp.]MDP2297962.1 pyridoxamine 5'-phosphate oxidase family protein [Pseudolabrys sp.]